MPPRLPALTSFALKGPSIASPLAAFLLPFLQSRNASILSSLSDNAAAYPRAHRIRRGRGPSSGKGKTSGRGHKGQRQHGKVPFGFQGGQTPDYVVHGERGFKNLFTLEYSPVNLDRIQSWIDQGRLDPKKPITLKELASSRCIHGVKDGGVKLLARGKDVLKTPIDILVSRASATAIEAVEAAGGKVMTRFYTKPAIKRIRSGKSVSSALPLALQSESGEVSVNPTAQRFVYRLPDPTSRKDLEYYRDPAHRGYLSHTVEEGHGPSLFFKTPGTGKVQKKRKVSGDAAGKGENKLW